MSETKDGAYSLIKEMALNNFQWSIEQAQFRWVGGKLEVDAVTLLSAKVDAMTKRLEQMNVNVVNSSAPYPCEIYGLIENISLHCQVRNPFSQVPNEINYVQNFNPRPTSDHYCNIYNLGWKNHPNLSYRLNQSYLNMPPMNARATPGFRRPLFPSRMPQKSNLEVMMENMIMAQQE